MWRYIALSLLLVSGAQAQVCFMPDGTTCNSAPTITNPVSASTLQGSRIILPSAASGVTPSAPVKGLLAMTNSGNLCVFNGTTWINVGAVSLISGLAVLCAF